jgi:hypothetical protein
MSTSPFELTEAEQGRALIPEDFLAVTDNQIRVVSDSLSGTQKNTRQARWRVRETRYINRYVNTSIGPPQITLSLGHRSLPRRGISAVLSDSRCE